MAHTPLTKQQKRLVREIDEVVVRLRMNYREIIEYEPEERRPRLNLIREHLIRGEIVLAYTWVDEALNGILRHHFFGRKSQRTLWRTKRFKNFSYYVLEKLSLMEKLAYVRALREVPKPVRRDVAQLNNLRNAIAHAFFPENLHSAKATWKGKGIFSLEGLSLFVEDLADIDDYFMKRAYGV